jgi:hypothetical protein
VILASAAIIGMLALPDVTIRTETRHGTAQRPVVTTNVLYIAHGNQRRESIIRFPDGRDSFLITTFTQCEQRRTVLVNDAARTYAYTPISVDAPVATVRRGSAAPSQPSGPVVDIVIDHRDTGERRQVGPFQARHVVTTTTVTPGPGAATDPSVRTEEGWYIDVPSECSSRTRGYGYAALVGSRMGERPRVSVHGDPTGLAIEETDDETSAGRGLASTTRLIGISDRPIDPALFTVPTGYQPALRVPGGGVDLTRPDTWRNRAQAYWEFASAWIRRVL